MNHGFKNKLKRFYTTTTCASLLFAWVAMGVLTVIHDQDHSFIQDAQCALCSTSLNLDHGLAASLLPVTQINYAVATEPPYQASFTSSQSLSHGNRDPPEFV